MSRTAGILSSVTRRVAIVGGGPTGLATAVLLARMRPDASIVVLEADAVLGGKARTVSRDGYTVDLGPNGFVANRPATLALVDAIGLTGDLQPAADAARHRYLFQRGGLRPLPTNPVGFLRSEVVSWPGKARALLEPLLVRAPAPDTAGPSTGASDRGPVAASPEESVHAFLARHFGRELADTFAQPLVVGITGGDARQLSVDALFPQFRAMERRHGSLVRALVHQQRSARAVDPPPSRPTGRLTSFAHGGMGRFTQALADALAALPNAEVRVGARVTALERVPGADPTGGYRLSFAAPDVHPALTADAVVLTLPATGAAALLDPLVPAAATALRAILYVGMRVFGLGFHRYDVPRPLDGFGFLVAPGERVRSLGVLWTSTIYPGRAPEGHVLVRVLAGGAVDPAMLDLPDDEALAVVRRDLLVTMGIAAEPAFVETATWREAIPQYTVGHLARVAAIERALGASPGLHLAGNAYRGVSVNDCVAEAQRVVGALVEPPSTP